MTDMLNLTDYREIMIALDRADATFRCGVMAEHLENIRDAVENCLFRDHGRLGFASEITEPPAAPVYSDRRTKLTADDMENVRLSTDPARIVAARYGISAQRVYQIRLTSEKREEVRLSKEPAKIIAARYGISLSRVSEIRRARRQ